MSSKQFTFLQPNPAGQALPVLSMLLQHQKSRFIVWSKQHAVEAMREWLGDDVPQTLPDRLTDLQEMCRWSCHSEGEMSMAEALSALFSPSMASDLPADWWAIEHITKKGEPAVAAQPWPPAGDTVNGVRAGHIALFALAHRLRDKYISSITF